MYRVSAQGVDKGRGSTDSSFHTHNMVRASFQCGNLDLPHGQMKPVHFSFHTHNMVTASFLCGNLDLPHGLIKPVQAVFFPHSQHCFPVPVSPWGKNIVNASVGLDFFPSPPPPPPPHPTD